MSYRGLDVADVTVRGRIRIADQLRRRYGIPLPVEISYDEFTVDTDENRLLKAALRRTTRLRLTDRRLAARVNDTLGALEGVSDMRFDRRSMPPITITRLNQSYATALDLARAIIEGTNADLFHGSTRTPTFLLDMDKVFEDFVYRALGDALSLDGRQWRQGASRRLDVAGRVTIKPDLSLWRDRDCVFVGDVKYKRTAAGENDDLYQLLAYCRALGVPSGVLIYATTEGQQIEHEVRRDGTLLRVRALDVSGSDATILQRVDELARDIESTVSELSTVT